MKEPVNFEFPAELISEAITDDRCPKDFYPRISYATVSHQVMSKLRVLKQFYSGSNIYTALLHAEVKESVVVNTRVAKGFLGFFYVMEGEVSFQMQGQLEMVCIERAQCFILYVPPGVYPAPWLPCKSTVAYFVLHTRLVRKTFNDYPELQAPFSKLLQKDSIPGIYHICSISRVMFIQLRKISSYQQDKSLTTEPAILILFNGLLEAQLQQLNTHKYSSIGTLEIAMRVYEYIRDNALLGPLPKVEEIATAHHIGHRTLLREFKNRFGLTLKDFINQEKMDAAHHLLVMDKLAVYKVSQLLGYADVQSFTRIFRSYFDYPPAEAKLHPIWRIRKMSKKAK